jgi:serine/threonine protein phosphatase PrpC
MEKIIRGTVVTDSETSGGKAVFCDFYSVVKKGHYECGDSAFVYYDERKAIFAVFDGVSGEGGASEASSVAAEAVLGSLKKHDKIDEEKMKQAIMDAQSKVVVGLTTAAIVFLQKDGHFLMAGIGDSPVFSIDSKGHISSELPLGRLVKDMDAVLKFFYYRNIVTSVIGQSDSELSFNMRQGKLAKGEIFILASDGLSDNLYVKTGEGYVIDSSGTEDLASLIGKERAPKAIVGLLMEEIAKRLNTGRVELKQSLLIPKEDDIAIIAVRKL